MSGLRYLLDLNVLVALAWEEHAHHPRVAAWLESAGDVALATCTITELGFIRMSANPAVIAQARSAADARDFLAQLVRVAGFERWAEPTVGALSQDVARALRAVRGHGQVTDAYLVALAASKGGRVATFDAGMKATWGQHVELIPS